MVRKVKFQFDERSLESIEKLRLQGRMVMALFNVELGTLTKQDLKQLRDFLFDDEIAIEFRLAVGKELKSICNDFDVHLTRERTGG